jgi:signal recognition particle receptor subunit beta
VIAYWGPGLSGKSTNLSVIREVLAGHAGADQESTQSVEVSPDRVLFDHGTEGGQLELFAPPGQAHHRLLRHEAFAEVDGVVFVADSSAGAVAVNLAALEELELLVASRHRELSEFALVFQFNKRDLCDALEVSRLQELLNPSGRPSVEAIATRGVGVFPSLKAVAEELKRCGRSAQVEAVGSPPGDRHHEEVAPLLGDVGGGEREGLEALAPCNGSPKSAQRGTSSLLARWSLVFAVGLGALMREFLELGWRIAAGGG